MVQLTCPIEGCSYVTVDGSEVIACALLAAHTVASAPMTSGPKLDRLKIDIEVTLEQWNMFERRWDVFVTRSGINPTHSSPQLFQCASEEIGKNLLKIDANITSKPTKNLLSEMKSLAVIAVARGVLRVELFQMRQDRDKSFRSYAARVRGKAETCSYTTRCSCDLIINFTDIIVKDVLIAGIADLDIRRDILGIDSMVDKSLTDVITLVESREMARNALPTPSSLDAISSLLSSLTHLLDNDDGDNDTNDTHTIKHSPFFNENQVINLMSSNNGLSTLDLDVCNAFTKYDELVLCVNRVNINNPISVICLNECWLSVQSGFISSSPKL